MSNTDPPSDKPRLRVVKDGDGPRSRKPTKAQRTQLQNVIEQLMLDGQRREQIAEVLAQAEQKGQLPHVSKATLTKHMQAIEQLWVEDGRSSRQQNRQKAVNRNLRHMREARKAGKWNSVHAFEETIAKLQGLFAPEHLQISFAQSENIARIIGDLNDDEYARMAEERERELREAMLYRQAIDTPGEPMPRDPAPVLAPPALPEKARG